jgi:leucyl/phenylalanyl-tRNA--protein transferase
VDILKRGEFTLLDTQWSTPHLEQFGAIEIPREDYLQHLGKAMSRKGSFPAADLE